MPKLSQRFEAEGFHGGTEKDPKALGAVPPVPRKHPRERDRLPSPGERPGGGGTPGTFLARLQLFLPSDSPRCSPCGAARPTHSPHPPLPEPGRVRRGKNRQPTARSRCLSPSVGAPALSSARRCVCVRARGWASPQPAAGGKAEPAVAGQDRARGLALSEGAAAEDGGRAVRSAPPAPGSVPAAFVPSSPRRLFPHPPAPPPPSPPSCFSSSSSSSPGRGAAAAALAEPGSCALSRQESGKMAGAESGMSGAGIPQQPQPQPPAPAADESSDSEGEHEGPQKLIRKVSTSGQIRSKVRGGGGGEQEPAGPAAAGASFSVSPSPS